MKHYCKTPFEKITINFDGDVSFCCPSFNNYYYIGNIFTDEIDDIWYSKKAEEFRKSILDGSYKFCNLDICGEYTEYNCLNRNQYKKDLLLNPKYPEIVSLQYSTCCNVRCKTCRDKLYLENKEETNLLNKIIDKIVLLCKNAKLVKINGGGELFTSPHNKKLLQKLISTYPNLKFIIHSNGLLCDEAHIKEWGLEGRVELFMISIHAATKKTYESIVRGGHWEQLQKNLKYLSTLKCDLRLLFVLHSLNYKEMPKFVKMADKLNAFVQFWRFRDWGGPQMCRDIDMYSCWEPWHPDYKDFLKVLNKLKRMKKYEYKYALIEEFLRKLQAQTTDPWYTKLNIFKK
ncbi:radical SAM protein [bacterium]|nr:radical SAM protein [bacterium]